MSTYLQILYQIVFSTKYRSKTLTKPNRERLFKFISGILENKRCKLYWINGVEDHLHIVLEVHPSVAVAELVKDIKLASTSFIKEEKLFANFNGWQEGYGAFTYNRKARENLIRYVQNQEIHHQKISSKVELIKLLEEHQIDYNPKYLE